MYDASNTSPGHTWPKQAFGLKKVNGTNVFWILMENMWWFRNSIKENQKSMSKANIAYLRGFTHFFNILKQVRGPSTATDRLQWPGQPHDLRYPCYTYMIHVQNWYQPGQSYLETVKYSNKDIQVKEWQN